MQYTSLTHLNLGEVYMRAGGAESLVEVLEQYTELTDLDLRYNEVGDTGTQRLRESWYSVRFCLDLISGARDRI